MYCLTETSPSPIAPPSSTLSPVAGAGVRSKESTQRPRRFLETFALFVPAQSLRRVSLALSLSSPRSLLRTGENFRRKPPPTVYLQTTFPVRACLGRSLSASCQDESLGRLPVFLSSSETTFAIGRSSARQSRVGTQDARVLTQSREQ